MEIPDMIANLREIKELDPKLHLFCQDPARANKTLNCLHILAYTGPDGLKWQDVVLDKYKQQLGNCDMCIIQYYKSKPGFYEPLRHEYNDEDVERFAAHIDELDANRITKGLDDASQTLRALPPDQRRQNAIAPSSIYALFEALTSESFLMNEELVKEHFDETFQLIQSRRLLKVTHYVPGLLMFLFSKEPQKYKWARENWAKLNKNMNNEEFEFAIRSGLSTELIKISEELTTAYDDSTTPLRLSRLWVGLQLIVSKMDSHMITHSLRAMEQDVYRFALDHLPLVNLEGLRSLLQTLQELLSKGPKDFWHAMGTISPTTIIEQVFNSRAFNDFTTGPEEKSSRELLSMLLGWIKPFMISLQTSQKSEACRALTTQLMSRLQGSSYAPFVREGCYRAGLDVICQTLMDCCGSSSIIDGVGRVVATASLDVAGEHVDEMLAILKTSPIGTDQGNLTRSCAEMVKYALVLECNVLRSDRHKLHNAKTLDSGFVLYKPKTWLAVSTVYQSGNLHLARILLDAAANLIGLEKFDSKKGPELPHPDERKQFNAALEKLFNTVSQIFEKINELDAIDIEALAAETEFTANLVKCLFLADQDVYHATLNLIKTISGAYFRKESIGYLLKNSFDTVVSAVSSATFRIAKSRAFAPCSRMLKICTDVLDLLCDSQDGVLRTRSLSNHSLEIVRIFWRLQWQMLWVIYDSTQGWAFHIRVATMSEFCRDVMQFSEHLFDQFTTFDAATKPVIDLTVDHGSETTEGSSTAPSKDLLSFPCEAMDGIIGFLKLRDEILLSICVKLIRKILLQLTDRETQISQTVHEKLQMMVLPSHRVTTNLTAQQKAEISRLLDENLGHILDDSSKEVSRATTPDLTLKQEPMKTSKKQGVIDMSSWTNKARIDHDGGKEVSAASPWAEKMKAKLALGHNQSPKSSTLPLSSTKPEAKQPVSQLRQIRAAAVQKAQQEAFLKSREQAKKEKKLRDADAVANAKKHILPHSHVGEGSALGNIGDIGKDHIRKSTEIMVSSDSESESDDEIDKIIFGSSKPKQSAAVAEYNASRRLQAQRQPVKKIKQIRTQKDLRARVAPDLSPIHKIILGWSFFHESDFPPASNRLDYSKISSSFRTALDYRKTFEPLLLLEAWQSFRQARNEASGKSLKIEIVNRMTLDSLLEISATLDLKQLSDSGLFEGDIILMSKSPTPTQAADQPNCLARVFKISRKPNILEVTFRVAHGNSLLEMLVPKTILYGEKVNSIVPLEREYGALLGLTYYDLCDEIVKAYPSPLLTYNDAALSKLVGCYELNKAQAKAVRSAIDNDAFTLIQGPPGSGKTKTIVAIVGALLSDAFTASESVAIAVPTHSGHHTQKPVPKKLLVCAPSNAAVDELVMRFMKGVKSISGEHNKPSIVRLGKSDNINPKVMEVTLDRLVDKKLNTAVAGDKTSSDSSNDMHKLMQEHKASCDQINGLLAIFAEQKTKGKPQTPEQSHQFEVLKRRRQQLSNNIDRLKDSGNTSARNADMQRNKVRQEIIDGAHILCATLSGSGHDMFRNLQLDFETVIIDEAAQSIELSALIPLKYGCSKCIMVGDPKQLPPTVLSREASRFQYEQSLFVRMQANSPENVHLLDTQYRMHPEISQFPSNAFYDSRLLDGPNMGALRSQPWHEDYLLSPYRFFDVKGMQQNAPKGHSLVNVAEIDFALKLFQRLVECARGYDFTGKVGIITPYKSQLAMLKDRFKSVYGNEIINTIEFNTTDAFQGRESEIIIFSCVRASGNGIGFLSDIRRMNVGITRAKSSLWVLGNSASLMQGEYWSQLIKDARQRGKYTEDVLKLIAQRPKVINIRSKPVLTTLPSRDVQDIEIPDADVVAASVSSKPKKLASDPESKRLKTEQSFGQKRGLSSPTEPQRPIKSHKTADEELVAPSKSGIMTSSESLPSLLGSLSTNSNTFDHGVSNASHVHSQSNGNAQIVRPPGSTTNGSKGKDGRPAIPVKKKTTDDSAFIIPKRKPR